MDASQGPEKSSRDFPKRFQQEPPFQVQRAVLHRGPLGPYRVSRYSQFLNLLDFPNKKKKRNAREYSVDVARDRNAPSLVGTEK